MLRDVGCRYAIVGHSERRALFGDTDDRVAAKAVAAFQAGLVPIVCLGETATEREAGQTLSVVRRQLAVVCGALELADVPRVTRETLVVAYEPIWAIGTGRAATSAEAQEVHADIRATIAVADATMARRLRIIYGGSVKSSNASEIFSMPDIDGGLIGGASLLVEEFMNICKAAAG